MTEDIHLVKEALPGYEVSGEIGRGGWGIVYAGTHLKLQRKVAIKQLPRAFGADPQVKERFISEAQLLAALDHPHIVPVFDYVEHQGICLLMMEWLPAGTVWDRFTSQGISPATACAVTLATCAGLHSAHERGVLHRDIKPENLIFNENNVLKVSDFGIAKVMTGNEDAGTLGGEVLGTPAYMAPEQARGTNIGPTTDVYAAATMLYELLTGRLPFAEDGDPLALLSRRIYEDPLPIKQLLPDLSEPLATVTMAGLATNPDERYQTAEEFGVVVAQAASATYGPGWLAETGVQVMAAGRILAAAESAPAGIRQTVAAPVPVAAQPRVRATQAVHAEGGSALDKRPEDLVALREVVKLPAFPTWQLAGAALLLVLAAILAFAGIGGDEGPNDLVGSSVTVAGEDPTSDDPIQIDFTKPLRVRMNALPQGARRATEARFSVSAGGITLAEAVDDINDAGRAKRALIDARPARFMIPQKTRAEIEFLAGNRVLAAQEFFVEGSQPFYLTLPAAAALVLALFTFAYSESLLKGMRRGKKQVVGIFGMLMMGALAGLLLVLLIWVFGGSPPTQLSLAIAIGCGAAAGVLSGLASTRIGKRRRVKRIEERKQRRGYAAQAA